MTSITLGPVALPLSRLWLLAALALVLLLAWWLSRRARTDLERPVLGALAIGLVAARLGYVATHFDYYRARPLHVLFLWQDGYLPAVGLVAAVAAAWLFARRGRYRARYVLVPLAAGALAWGGLVWVTERFAAPQARLPELALESLDGGRVRLQAFAGQPVVANLWASWCPPCRREMPVLAEAQRQRPSVHFLFINQGEAAGIVQGYLAEQRLQLDHVLLDPSGEVARHFGTRAMPTTLFFDAGGRLVDAHLGELSAPRLADYVERISRASRPGAGG